MANLLSLRRRGSARNCLGAVLVSVDDWADLVVRAGICLAIWVAVYRLQVQAGKTDRAYREWMDSLERDETD